ncbi:MAG: oligosaccharide flippase family protein, partial [Acidithiobacillus sp.]
MREEQDAAAFETTRAIENGPRLTHSTLFNLAGAAIPAALLLITVPIYLRFIGEARYGVLAIVWLLLGYFAVFDLGFGRAVANRIATLHQGTAEERQGVFWTGLVISGVTAIVGGVLLYLLAGWLFADVLHVQGTIQREAEHAMPWLALALPLAIIISLLAGTLEGRQAFLPLNAAQIFGTVLYQIFPLATAALGWISLPYLIAAALVGRLLSALLLFILCYRYVPLTWKPKITTAEIKPLLRYGGWITLTGVVGPLLTVFDRFLIGAKIGM